MQHIMAKMSWCFQVVTDGGVAHAKRQMMYLLCTKLTIIFLLMALAVYTITYDVYFSSTASPLKWYREGMRVS